MKTQDSIKSAVTALKQGELIAYPSEGVWGVGCDPYNKKAVMQILALKSREISKGLILVASSLEQIAPLLEALAPEARKVLALACPGPDTWLIPDPGQVIPSWIKGNFDTVAVRVSEHPVIKKICDEFAGPIVSTSANPAGLLPAKTQAEVEEYFSSGLKCIVPGNLGSSSGPSVIKDLLSGRILRP